MDVSALDDHGGGAFDDSYDGVTLAGAVGDGPGTVTEELPEGSAPNDPDQKDERADDPDKEDDMSYPARLFINDVERLQYHIKPELHAKADDDTRRTLDLLQSEFDEITAATPCKVEFLIEEDSPQQLWEASRKSDPLRVWFIRAPNAEVLNAGTILRRGVAYGDPPNVYRRPAVESTPAMVKFWNLRQYCVYQVYGGVDEADNTEGLIEELRQVEFTCRVALLRTAYGANQNPDTALILVSYNKEGDYLLTDQGENCKTMVNGIELVKNEPYKNIDFVFELFEFIMRRMDFAIKSRLGPNAFLGQADYLKSGIEDSRQQKILARLKEVYEFHKKEGTRRASRLWR
ncbi:hypothetical protein DL770_007245 [Monosporascus sp. CRB-9-2]|nr:hypothetical protein DL770_007245 [Monosporascus sp. CRB-9-2]